ncbi:uncharacterized protein SPSK_02029 [Sporothrix schenckii 1099-18]|uniref:Uncharacterized protein n=1 Tax=Sporothrix schenckii 1099-18 TaxID=1397361 RepID=A0A0F2MBL1_SPOSC|nr:uncharacterized protein SPSK_02029 [Sporothrix schenckii 1099-18]KJR87088.1 hypothetical protein SPSK_02029 [Sporothrix schenckii 1099-18]
MRKAQEKQGIFHLVGTDNERNMDLWGKEGGRVDVWVVWFVLGGEGGTTQGPGNAEKERPETACEREGAIQTHATGAPGRGGVQHRLSMSVGNNNVQSSPVPEVQATQSGSFAAGQQSRPARRGQALETSAGVF